MTFQADVPQHADMAARLAPIRAHFVGTLPPRRDRLVMFLATSGERATDPAVMRQLQEDAHKIRGVAPTLGFDALGQVAARADEILEPWRDSVAVIPVTDDVIQSLAQLLAEVEKLIVAA
jgi:HPt (histidine-containing phosphotransfer) domain-containing protein